MEEENNEKKRQVRLAIIGVAALLLLTLGATFAFFLIDTDSSTSKSNIKGDISKAGVATLVPKTDNLHINLSVSDMAEAKQGTEYYGDELESNPYVLSEEEGTHTISQVQITDGEETTKYSCTAKVVVTMEIAEDNNMGSVLEPGDLILQFKGNLINEKLDLSEISEVGTKEYNISFKLTGNTTEDIQAYIKLINKSTNQNYLASRNLKVDINTTELSCDIFTPNTKLIAELREKSNGKLTEDLVYGLYRYQGNSTIEFASEQEMPNITQTVNNNYICLGSDCSTEESDDMYRIIGINEDGEMKVIKATPANDSIQWNNRNSDVAWPNSDIYKWLNGISKEGGSGGGYPPEQVVLSLSNSYENGFYNSLPIELKEKIVNATWKYGDINPYSDEQNVFTPEELEKDNELYEKIDGDGTDDEKRLAIKEISKMETDAFLRTEAKATDSIKAKIGLMSLTDYCSSFESNGEINCNTSVYSSNLETPVGSDYGLSWLTTKMEWNSGNGWEWTMSRYGFNYSYYHAWSVDANGILLSYNVNNENAARPVFYLASDVDISGSGTIGDPFRIGIE